MGGFISSFYNNNVAWVPDDTPYVLPPMNVNPDMIFTSGFSGGAFYANMLAIIYSETFAGGGSKSGGPMGAGFGCSTGLIDNSDKCDSEWVAETVEWIKEMADEGLIDPVSNLVDMPWMVMGGELDPTQTPAI